MEDNMKTAGVCGLFCESCGVYIATQENTIELLAKKTGKPVEDLRCNGCRTDTLSYYCRTLCKMKSCAAEKGCQFCSECNEYPCDVLKEFQVQMPHRIELFASLDYVKENGYEAWKDKMKKDYSCEECGTINTIYTFECRKCNHHPSNPYVGRNIEKIVEAIKK